MSTEEPLGEVLWTLAGLRGQTASDLAQTGWDDPEEVRRRMNGRMGALVEGALTAELGGTSALDRFGLRVRVAPLDLKADGTGLTQGERVVFQQVDYHSTVGIDRWSENPQLRQLAAGLLLVWYLRDIAEEAARPVLWSDLWVPTVEQGRQMQRDYEQIAAMIRNGEHLDSTGEVLATCPRHGGGWDITSPADSDPGSQDTHHPTLEVAEQRAWQVKRRAVEDILRDSLCAHLGGADLEVSGLLGVIGRDPQAGLEQFLGRSTSPR